MGLKCRLKTQSISYWRASEASEGVQIRAGAYIYICMEVRIPY